MRKFAPALLLACSPLSVCGTDQWDHGFTVGVGQKSCGAFMQAMRAHPPNGQGYTMQGADFVSESEMYQQWIWGYVTAVSFRFHLPPAGDGAGYTEWVAHWCESHADERVGSAVGALVAHLRDKAKAP